MNYHDQYKFDMRKNRNQMRQLLMKVAMLRLWQEWEKNGKEESQYQLWPDMTKHLDKFVSEHDQKFIGIETDADREAFVKDIIYVWTHLGGESWILGNDNLYPLVECVTGNDGDLKYYYQCADCGTIIIVDHSVENCLRPILCPKCCKLDKCEWGYYTPETDGYDTIKKIMYSDKFYWDHRWYQKLIGIKIDIKQFFWRLTHGKEYKKMVETLVRTSRR